MATLAYILGWIFVGISIVLGIIGMTIMLVGWYVMIVINRDQRRRIEETSDYYGDPDAD